jgi:hypothetical protein
LPQDGNRRNDSILCFVATTSRITGIHHYISDVAMTYDLNDNWPVDKDAWARRVDAGADIAALLSIAPWPPRPPHPGRNPGLHGA